MTVFFSSGLPGLLHVQQGYGWHMHDGAGYMMGSGWGGWGGWAIAHGIFWLVVLIAAVMLTLALIRRLDRDGGGTGGHRSPSALDQLDERYARGEIDREEYLQRKKDISER